MDDLFSLLVLLFFLLPFIEGLFGRKRKRQGPPPQEGRRRPDAREGKDWTELDERMRRRREARAAKTAERDTRAGHGAERGGTAAEMLPDELWEILTGERRMEVPEPSREAADEEVELARAEEERAVEEARRVEAARARERSAAQRERELAEAVRRRREAKVTDRRPIIVSMETPPPSPEARHEAFHDKIEQLGVRMDAVAAAADAARARRRRLVADLGHPASLRRAVLLREVLGPPKGLEEPAGWP